MRGMFKGAAIKELVWKAATRTTTSEFDAAMEELKGIHEGAYNYLKEIAAQHWSRSHFTGRSLCDALLNNLCEVFNSKLVEGRDKPIISCLEFIREYLMKRIVIVQRVIDKSQGPLTPTIQAMFELIKKGANRYSALWNGGDKFQVKDAFQDQQVVDLRLRTCTCRRWELSGIPCRHAVASIWNMQLNSMDVGLPENWVNPLYRLENWKEVYQFKVEPVLGSRDWPRSRCPTKLLPPFFKNQVGRPKKKRRRSALENEPDHPIVKDGKLTRSGKTVKCGKCGAKGHNSRVCKGAGPSKNVPRPKKPKNSAASQPNPIQPSGSQPSGSQPSGSQPIMGNATEGTFATQ